jgi:hypothetical protein
MSRVDVNANEADQGAAARVRGRIEHLGPYQSLVLLAVPACVVEPMKLAAVAIAGDGHWITGTGMIVAAYTASLLLVERLFQIVKPKLLTLPWFASLWARFASLWARGVALRAEVIRWTGWERRRPVE